jgi:hypothetical protein
MSTALRRRLARYCAAGLVGTTVLAGTSAATAPSFPLSQRDDLVSSAHPTQADPEVRDETVRAVTVVGMRPRAAAAATASADCHGCHGTAVTVQVVRVGWGRQVTADNVAAAWARCRACGGHATSVQVVLLPRPAAVAVTNRALAVTAGCDGCTARAAAYQVVVHAPAQPVDLDRLVAELAAWAERQPAAGTEPRSAARTMRRQARHDLIGLERRVTRLVPGTVLDSAAAVRDG